MNNSNVRNSIETIYKVLNNGALQIPVFLGPYIRRFIRFLSLPYCYLFMVNWSECSVSRGQVFKDLCYIFFKLKYFPDNYSACRLFEKERHLWHYYYGSNYDPYQRAKLRTIQPKEYEVLFEDKEVCIQLCAGLNIPIPKSLGIVDPKSNYREDLIRMIRLNQNNELIVKPVRGSAGIGIVKIYEADNVIMVKDRDNDVRLDQFVLDERALVQDVVTQDKDLSKISEMSINTIRVLTLHTISNDILILGATIRFGVGKSHIDNWSAGGIAVGVDVNKGTLKSTAFDKQGNQYTRHPVSKVIFKGVDIPKWKEVKALSETVQSKFPYYKLLGMDIAVTTDGPVIIEINAIPDFVFQEQTSGPLLDDRRNFTEFKNYNLLINKYQKRL